MIQFTINHQTIERTDSFQVVGDSYHYLLAKFCFASPEWTGIKTAIFRRGDDAYEMILDDDACYVPWEVLHGEGVFYVSVFCGDLVTANMARVNVYQSGYGSDLESAHEPTAGVYAQILDALDEVQQTLDTVIEDAEGAAKDAESSATEAETSAGLAHDSEVAAGNSASSAEESAQAAAQSANAASLSAGSAADSETAAARSAEAASASAGQASGSAQTASAAAQTATEQANRAVQIVTEADQRYSSFVIASVSGEGLVLTKAGDL